MKGTKMTQAHYDNALANSLHQYIETSNTSKEAIFNMIKTIILQAEAIKELDDRLKRLGG